MTADKITVPILFGEKEELYTLMVSSEQYERIMSEVSWSEILLTYNKNTSENIIHF